MRTKMNLRRGDLGRPISRKNSLRLSNWDYSLPGPYFFTICTFEHKEIFDSQAIRNQIIEVFKNIAGEIKSTINTIVIATNHIHGIVTLGDDKKISLSEYIGRAKVKTTQKIKGQASLPLRLWQRSFYEHVIRNENDFLEKAKYIDNHPMKEQGDIYAEWH